jgi:hypothetical protein
MEESESGKGKGRDKPTDYSILSNPNEIKTFQVLLTAIDSLSSSSSSSNSSSRISNHNNVK